MDASGAQNRGRKRSLIFDAEEKRPRSSKRSRSNYEEQEANNGNDDLLGRSHGNYTVAWICALPIELAAAQAMLDNVHNSVSGGLNDSNSYTLGNIGPFNIVIACLPSGHYGTNNAAIVASNINRSFPSIEMGFMVGIGGGVPTKADIRLGDVVVSNEVVQYDFGKTIQEGEFCRTSNPVRPPQAIMTAVATLRARYELEPTGIPGFVSEMLARHPRMEEYAHPSVQDQLFQSDYEHDKLKEDCKQCDSSKLQKRLLRPNKNPKVHYGVIASGNQVMKHGKTRDSWAQKDNVLCFEMEAAGLMDHFPCLVIRGICDYSDSHKNKLWQRYAAATAAAYAKELISTMRPRQTQALRSRQTRSSGRIKEINGEQTWALVQSLRFDQIDARHDTIKKAHAKTCEWLLRKDEYLHWLDSTKLDTHNGFMWIKGKPGTGKSTLMKFILRTARRSMDKTIISFFFNARGGDLEKSTIGMYRSLLLQLLQQIPDLQHVFSSYMPTWKDDQIIQWNIEVLKELFEQMIQNLGKSSVACFIDALDECDENQIRDMVSFFEGLSKMNTHPQPKFYICFSSRHYPHITINTGLNLVLEGQEGHTQDITDYIQSELKIGQSTLAEQIRTELQEKAAGVFMWVVLVVDMLNKEHDNGHMYALRRRLQETPGDLHELFRNILTRDQQYRDELLLCVQWVLFARVPLKPEQLYFAVLSGINDEAPPPWDQNEVSIADMKRFILSCSKGLAEVTESKCATVQFIHESVRDFLLKGNGLRSIWPDVEDVQGQGHERLKRCCTKYNMADISPFVGPTMSPQDISEKTRRSVIQRFPLLKYSVRNCLYHADQASGYGISQKDFLHTLKLETWINLHNILERYEIRRYSLRTRLIYILAEANMPELIRICSPGSSSVEEKDERYGCPLLAAIANESKGAIEEFRKGLASSLPTENPIRLRYAYYKPDENGLHELGRNFTFSKERTILTHLATYGDAGLLALTIEARQLDPDSRDEIDGRTPLSWAAYFGHGAAVRLLLESERVDPNAMDRAGRPPIRYAIYNSQVEAVKLLIGLGKVDPELRDSTGRTLLSRAAYRGNAAVTKFLVEDERVDPNSTDKKGRTPLYWAASKKFPETVRALLQSGRVGISSDKLRHRKKHRSLL